jgi:hypothetical protein
MGIQEEKEVEENVTATVWLDPDLDRTFRAEVARLGLTKSQVLRQLIKRWVIQRQEAKKRAKALDTLGQVEEAM